MGLRPGGWRRPVLIFYFQIQQKPLGFTAKVENNENVPVRRPKETGSAGQSTPSSRPVLL